MGKDKKKVKNEEESENELQTVVTLKLPKKLPHHLPKHKAHADNIAYKDQLTNTSIRGQKVEKKPVQVTFEDDGQQAGPSYAHTFTPPSSAEVKKPLLATSWRGRYSSTLMSVLKKAAVLEKMKRPEYEEAELASEDMCIGMETSERLENAVKLLQEVRSLPCNMQQKREHRKEILASVPLGTQHRVTLNHFKRYMEAPRMLKNYFAPLLERCQLWSSSLKLIEARYGTGVLSYFLFLRLLLCLNLITFAITFVFAIGPQVFGTPLPYRENVSLPADTDDSFNWTEFDIIQAPTRPPVILNQRQNNKLLTDLGVMLQTHVLEGFLEASLLYSEKNSTSYTRVLRAERCHKLYKKMMHNLTRHGFVSSLQGFLEGSDWMEDTILFLGHYEPDFDIGIGVYRLSVAFLVITIVLIVVNIALMMNYASQGVQEAMLDYLDEMYCYIVFCGWNFCITEARAAKRQHGSIFQELVSSVAENRRASEMKEWTTDYKIKVYAIRGCIHLMTGLIVIGGYYLIFYVAGLQVKEQRKGTTKGFAKLMIEFLPSLTITAFNLLFPVVLHSLVPYEQYRTGQMINISLVRIVLLRLSSIIILISSFYGQINCEPMDYCLKGYEQCPSPICWETYVGQQVYRLTLMDLFVHMAITLLWETSRNYAVRRWSNKLTNFIGRSRFDIPLEVLGLVYSQTLCWLGMLYCPLLSGIMVMKISVMFYLKKFNLMKNCDPGDTAYKASRSNAIFVIVLMLSFFISVGVVGFSVLEMVSSPACSPFRYFLHIMHALPQEILLHSEVMDNIINLIFSPVFAYPLIVLLCLGIYYFVTRIFAHTRMVKLLKVQLAMEGRDKQFLLDRVTKIKPNTDTAK